MVKKNFQISRTILSLLAYLLMLVITIATAYYLLGFINNSMRSKAASAVVLAKGNVDTITNIRLDPMHYCKYKSTPYEVTGVKNGEPVTVHVCYSGVKKLDYVD